MTHSKLSVFFTASSEDTKGSLITSILLSAWDYQHILKRAGGTRLRINTTDTLRSVAPQDLHLTAYLLTQAMNSLTELEDPTNLTPEVTAILSYMGNTLNLVIGAALIRFALYDAYFR